MLEQFTPKSKIIFIFRLQVICTLLSLKQFVHQRVTSSSWLLLKDSTVLVQLYLSFLGLI